MASFQQIWLLAVLLCTFQIGELALKILKDFKMT
jgi:hypothetical protein